MHGKHYNNRSERRSILCISNLNGDFNKLKNVVKTCRPAAVLHTGNFGFLDKTSLEHLNERTLQTLAQNSTVISPERKKLLLSYPSKLFKSEITVEDLSDFAQYASGTQVFPVPIYTTHGSLDDIVVLEGLKNKPIKNLYFLHDGFAPLVDCGTISMRLFGLGGLFLRNKLFDHGSGTGTMAGGEEGSWATLLQLGSLIDTARECESPNEVRVLLTHTDPSSETILSQLASAIKADYTISPSQGGICSSGYTQRAIYPVFDDYFARLEKSHHHFDTLYAAVAPHYEKHLEKGHQRLVNLAKNVILYLPPPTSSGLACSDSYYQNSFHYSLCEASLGHLLFLVNGTQVRTELISSGVNFEHRACVKVDTKPEPATQEGHEVPWIRADNSDQSPRQVIKALSNGIHHQPMPAVQPPPTATQKPDPPADRPDTPVSATSVDDQVVQESWADGFEEPASWEEEIQKMQANGPVEEPPSKSRDTSANKPPHSQTVSAHPEKLHAGSSVGSQSSSAKDFNDTSELGLPTSRWSKPEPSQCTAGTSTSSCLGVSRAEARSPRPSSTNPEFLNAWGIEFIVWDKQSHAPPQLNEASGRLIYVHPGCVFDPATGIEELFHGFESEIVRIFLIVAECYIHVEIKDPERMLGICQELGKREYHGNRVRANPKRDGHGAGRGFWNGRYSGPPRNGGGRYHDSGSRMSQRDNYPGEYRQSYNGNR
ncbi:hypothetical protein DSO57_1026861 [Entomophthora muscae]|uniref:Uncharacterized protein n=1 Tax=Entomophthora muscae TaxID=34485 RepID=A0ACC2SEI7_9FUNG|nr:hypothetical protein DSO57_1026861 [Entomophthora muscae]